MDVTRIKDPRVNVDTVGKQDALFLALEALDLPMTDDMAEQLSFFVEAMALYDVRGKKYGEAWKSYGAQDCMFHVRSKYARLSAQIERIILDSDVELDDGIDMINYVVFAMRNALAGNVEGALKGLG